MGPGYQFYDQGVELTKDGLYGHHGYIEHATRGTLSLHSLYLLLWANFAAFCIALFSQSEAKEKLVGNVFSENVEPVMKLTISIAYHRFTIITCLWYSAHLSCPVGSQGLGKAWSLASKDQCWSQLNALNEPVDVTSADTV